MGTVANVLRNKGKLVTNDKVDEMNQGPSTPVGNYDGKIMQKVGAAGIGRIRPKDGKSLADLLKKV